ncbi:MAG: winged helix-turn-helix domain-containing protein [Flavobacteriaceae bacterium]
MPVICNMIKRKYFLLVSIFCLSAVAWTQEEVFSERAKVALRVVGNELLLASQDSSSLVLPVVERTPFLYELSFEKPFTILPDSIQTLVSRTFLKAHLPSYYRVSLLLCDSGEVAYSYEMMGTPEKSLLPCNGRQLPKDCYVLNVRFLPTETQALFVTDTSSVANNNLIYTTKNEGVSIFSNKKNLWYFLLLVMLVPVGWWVFKRKRIAPVPETEENYQWLGGFQFYPTQHLLVIEGVKVSLSNKECDILCIFVDKPNQIISREELTKRVWEDRGVVVGRSLDTYISKLRKKLQIDPTLKITNVHGVGYSLELL